MVKNYLPFVKIEANQNKKKQVPKKQAPKQQKHVEVTKPKTYLQKQEEAKNEEN